MVNVEKIQQLNEKLHSKFQVKETLSSAQEYLDAYKKILDAVVPDLNKIKSQFPDEIQHITESYKLTSRIVNELTKRLVKTEPDPEFGHDDKSVDLSGYPIESTNLQNVENTLPSAPSAFEGLITNSLLQKLPEGLKKIAEQKGIESSEYKDAFLAGIDDVIKMEVDELRNNILEEQYSKNPTRKLTDEQIDKILGFITKLSFYRIPANRAQAYTLLGQVGVKDQQIENKIIDLIAYRDSRDEINQKLQKAA